MVIAINDGLLQIFDVDHGQCALLTLPSKIGNRFVLVDCGHASEFKGGSWYPGAHLQSLGVQYIDLLIITNYDEDHASGFADLQDRGITIGCILGNPTVSPNAIYELKRKHGLGKGIEALAGALQIRRDMVWPQIPPDIPGMHLTWAWNPYPAFDEENNLSLVSVLNIRGWRFMFPGDMELKGWTNLLTTCPPFRQLLGSVNFLIAAHHGRDNGICRDMFDVYGCKPHAVIISDCEKKFATQETTDYYASKVWGLRYFRNDGPRNVLTTRWDSEIRFSFNGSQCLVW